MGEISYEELCQQMVQACNEAIIYSDREGVIRLWNAGAEQMLGFSAQEAIGQSLDMFIPQNQRARHWAGYSKVMETGITRYARELLAAPAIRKDGTRISTEFSMTIIRDDTGRIAGTAAVIREVTARWQKEQVIKTRLAELEQAAAPADKMAKR